MTEPGDWPYADLVLRTPHCPFCGTPGLLIAGHNMYPMAFCPNNGCKAFSWDPTIAAAELIAGAHEVTETETGSTD